MITRKTTASNYFYGGQETGEVRQQLLGLLHEGVRSADVGGMFPLGSSDFLAKGMVENLYCSPCRETIPTQRIGESRHGVKISRRIEMPPVCCWAGRSSTALGTSGVPVVTGTSRTTWTGASVFGGWCAQPFSLRHVPRDIQGIF